VVRCFILAAVLTATLSFNSALAVDEKSTTSDYPTVTRADYVFGCMQVNGNTRPVLERCSCSIDVISSILPHDDYVEAETVMSVGQRGGENGQVLRSPQAIAKVKALKSAQVEGELRCF
jgi:hypothetical protein